MTTKAWKIVAATASVALLAGVVVARTVEIHSCGAHSAMAAGEACGVAGSARATGDKDLVMSVVCERSCAVKEKYDEADLVLQPGAREGDLTRCPVSGVVFHVTAAHPRVEYRGQAFRLCCGGCEGKFRANPARFVSS